MTESFRESAFGLPVSGCELAAMLHAPSAPRRALLTVAPPVEERKACLWPLVDLARRLAEEGTVVLRFDPRGCGDSPGAFADYALTDWLADTEAAAAWLRGRHPGLPLNLLGIRFGACLAEAAAGPADGLILIEPVSGSAFIKQLQQRSLVNQMLAFGAARTGRAAMEKAWRAGETVDLDGYAFPARLWRDLLEHPLPDRPARTGPALVVSTGSDGAAADAWARRLPGCEQVSLRLPAFWNTVGHVDVSPLLAAVRAWVGERAGASAPGSATAPDGPSDAAERFISFPSALGAVRGVLHMPQGVTAGQARRILFLPGWSGDRGGPHRMFVHAARRLAAAGHTCLRIDYGGRGESGGGVSDATIATMTADALAALDWLRTAVPDGGPQALAAICSGCKVAIQAAAEMSEAVELVLWSAEAMGSLRSARTGRRKAVYALRAYARKLLRPETWRKLLRGQVNAGMVRRALANREAPSPEETQREDRALRRFQSFGGRILFTFGGSDPDAPGSSAAYAAFCGRHGIAHDVLAVPHAGHSYYALAWEARVLDATEAFFNRGGRESHCLEPADPLCCPCVGAHAPRGSHG